MAAQPNTPQSIILALCMELDTFMFTLRRMHEGDILTFALYDNDGEECEPLTVYRHSSDFYAQVGGQDTHGQAFDISEWVNQNFGLNVILGGVEGEGN